MDYECQVWVNNRLVGTHKGGNNPFSFDITKYLKKSGSQSIEVAVTDPTDTESISRGNIVGGALAVICYLFVGIAMHRKADNVTRFLDYSVLVPRAVPGLLAGLAFLWVFLFVPMWLDQSLKHGWLSALPVADWMREHLIVQLRALRNTIFSVWLAYTVVWMAYGLRLISSTLLQVGPELEEAARSTGASRGQITRHVTVPLSRYGLIGSWLLMFLIFEREYSTGVYLLSPGTETIGSMLVSLWAAGAIDIVAALSFINILLVVIGLGIALRFGVKLHD